MKNSFKNKIELLSLSYVKEMTILLIVDLLIIGIGVVSYLYLKEIVIVIIAAILIAVFTYLYLNRYTLLLEQKERELMEELISLISYFELFLSNGNTVYSSLSMLTPYASPQMDEHLNNLLKDIDNDKSVTPFIDFSKKFKGEVVEPLMLSIYQMIDNGGQGDNFLEFDTMFSSISKEYKTSKIDRHKKKLESLTNWPLFASGFITIALSISIIAVIGDYINVI